MRVMPIFSDDKLPLLLCRNRESERRTIIFLSLNRFG